MTFTDWNGYYDEFENREPHEMLFEVLGTFGEGRYSAIDLGCGPGIDTRAMLERGWSVFATDAQQEAIDRLRRRVADDLAARLETAVARMEDVGLPRADLVWASFSLFFCRPEEFADVWAKVTGAILPAGRFAGQLLGDRDAWAPNGDISAFTRDEALALFDALELERFDEVEEEGDVSGEQKHWHYFHAIARRPAHVATEEPFVASP
jgi:tellurite methyltransferase